MNDAWFSFAVVILVQFVLFIIHAYFEKRISQVLNILAWGILIGAVFGVLFDGVVGKLMGLYRYELGFDVTFLLINGAFSYGLMQANTLLMQRVSFFHFYVWTIIVGIIYEVTNHFFRVWTWDFSTPYVEFIVVHAVGYIGLATLMAIIWHMLLRHRFVFIDRALSKKF